MVKQLGMVLLLTLAIDAKELSKLLEKNCISCHVKQKIPSELIYRRYLLKYSTHNNIKGQLLHYLREPNPKNSIMPKQFFLKFPTKIALDLNATLLEAGIDAYLDYFDVKKKLILK